jgi:hypothetical protein
MRAERGRTRRLTHIAATSKTAKPRKRTPEGLPPADAAAVPPKKWKNGTGGIESLVADDDARPLRMLAGEGVGDARDAGDSDEGVSDEAGAAGIERGSDAARACVCDTGGAVA